MTRAPHDNVVKVQPRNNIFTALTAAALVASVIALIVLFIKANAVFPGGLLG